MEWTEETISRLRSLWQEGLSTAEIGRRLSITKNAVVGKAHRLTLPARPSPIRKAEPGAGGEPSRSRREASRPPKPIARLPERRAAHENAEADIAIPSPRPQSPPPAPTPIREMEPASPRLVVQSAPRRRGQTCCWPLGEPGTKQFHFCGGEPLPGKPYCGEHAQLAYVKLRDRRDTVA